MNKSENKGLISVDRNNKVTLRLTIPCSMFKSSAKDLSLEIFGFTMWANTRLEHNGMIQAAHGASLNVFAFNFKRSKLLRSSTDSDLEAFSHNPTDGSFAPLAVQPRARTKCPNQRFLSY